MRVISFITDPPVRTILLHLELPHRPTPLAPARAPPQAELSFYQTPAFDPSRPHSAGARPIARPPSIALALEIIAPPKPASYLGSLAQTAFGFPIL